MLFWVWLIIDKGIFIIEYDELTKKFISKQKVFCI